MNKDNLNQIFTEYIDKFEFVNDAEHMEYYKWQICREYPVLMKKALEANAEDFPSALYEVKKCTKNVIDSYTQPFMGLVELAKKEPETVRKMLIDLYADDGGDLKVQMKLISDFFEQHNVLLNKYFPDSFLYKQNSHSVSAMLFLNDPEHHYMYKAVQCQSFADSIEYYNDWGTGDNIKLDVFYKMCDEVVEEIKKCPELLDTDKRRFDGRLDILYKGEMHPDMEKHILLFDIIYCCNVYDLFNKISYNKLSPKEKKEHLVKQSIAERLRQAYERALADSQKLEEAYSCFVGLLSNAGKIKHKKYGEGTVCDVSRDYIVVEFQEKKTQISLPMCISNGIIMVDNPEYDEKAELYRNVLKRYNTIPQALEYAMRELKPYEEFLD